uniref:Uncharacterized protein n=1 Tax=Arundo donax TaxID=35708 RepID=A0A0A9QJK3_ARUDO
MLLLAFLFCCTTESFIISSHHQRIIPILVQILLTPFYASKASAAIPHSASASTLEIPVDELR